MLEQEKPETRKLKRTMVCCHPLEWDKGMYLEDGNIKREIINAFGIWNREDRKNHFKNQVNAIDIWDGLKGKQIEGLDTSKNNFWYAHPVYFINHLDRAGLLKIGRVEALMRIQDEVVALKCLERGNLGLYPEIWPEGIAPSRQTYCNHAVYLTIQAFDKKYTNFTNTTGEFPDAPKGYATKGSNYWCDVLEIQAKNTLNTGIVELNIEKAQEYANRGYVVIGAWKNQKPGEENPPHFVTVRPGFKYDKDSGGPTVANVGVFNNTNTSGDKAFPGMGNDKLMLEEVKWYYNSKQDLYNEPYMDEINRLKGKTK
jgi:hypothetical protein